MPEQLEALRLWDGSPMPSGLRRRVLRVYAHHQFLSEQIAELEAERRPLLQSAQEASIEKVRQLMQLQRHRDQWGMVVGDGIFWLARVEESSRGGQAVAGLTPTPYQSGESARDQGITKSGNRQVRWMTMELAWSWGRYQPRVP